ncbi:MAG: hypothetical protein ACQKBU_02785 [Verrucomicrobiales bacterium]
MGKHKAKIKDLRPELRRVGMTVVGFARWKGFSSSTTRHALSGYRSGRVSKKIRALAEQEIYEKS